MISASNGLKELIPLLKEKELGMVDRDGNTALIIAIKSLHKECAMLLLEEAGKVDK